MSNDDCVEAKMDTVIDRRVFRLRENQDQVEELVSQLYGKLSGILEPEAPTSDGARNPEACPSPPTSKHAFDLEILGDRSSGTMRRLAELITRIEL